MLINNPEKYILKSIYQHKSCIFHCKLTIIITTYYCVLFCNSILFLHVSRIFNITVDLCLLFFYIISSALNHNKSFHNSWEMLWPANTCIINISYHPIAVLGGKSHVCFATAFTYKLKFLSVSAEFNSIVLIWFAIRRKHISFPTKRTIMTIVHLTVNNNNNNNSDKTSSASRMRRMYSCFCCCIYCIAL